MIASKIACRRLAPAAEARAAVLYRHPLDGAAANGAGLAFSVSNLEIEMGCTQLALWADVCIHACALAADPCPKNLADTIM